LISVASAGAVNTGVGGTVVSIDHAHVAADPTFPTRSVARTWKEWFPSASPPYVVEDVHEVPHPALSTSHSNVAVSDAVNPNVALEDVEIDPGLLPIVVTGGVRSNVTRRAALHGETLPAMSWLAASQ
jgi:hypothetical protein